MRMQHGVDRAVCGNVLALMVTALALLPGVAALAAPAHDAVPSCGANSLRLSVDGRDGDFNGMSHGGTALSIRNLGRACTLSAALQLQVYDAHGKRLPVRFDGAPSARATPVLLAGGHRAEIEIRWVAGPVYPHSRKLRAAGIGVRGEAVLLHAPLDAVMYGPTGQPVVVQQTALRAIEGMAADR